MKFTGIPWALDVVWRFYATHASGLESTGVPVRGTDRARALELEALVITEAIAA